MISVNAVAEVKAAVAVAHASASIATRWRTTQLGGLGVAVDARLKAIQGALAGAALED